MENRKLLRVSCTHSFIPFRKKDFSFPFFFLNNFSADLEQCASARDRVPTTTTQFHCVTFNFENEEFFSYQQQRDDEEEEDDWRGS